MFAFSFSQWIFYQNLKLKIPQIKLITRAVPPQFFCVVSNTVTLTRPRIGILSPCPPKLEWLLGLVNSLLSCPLSRHRLLLLLWYSRSGVAKFPWRDRLYIFRVRGSIWVSIATPFLWGCILEAVIEQSLSGLKVRLYGYALTHISVGQWVWASQERKNSRRGWKLKVTCHQHSQHLGQVLHWQVYHQGHSISHILNFFIILQLNISSTIY